MMQYADNVVPFRRLLPMMTLPDERVFDFNGAVPDQDDEGNREAQIAALVARLLEQAAAFHFTA